MNTAVLTVSSVDETVLFQAKRGTTNVVNDRWASGIALCLEGRITYTVNGKPVVLIPGRAAFLPRHCSYSFICNEDGRFPVINFSCVGLFTTDIEVFELRDPSSCIRTFERLRQTFTDPDARLKRFALVYELLYKITDRQKAIPDPLRRALRYMEERLGDADLSNVKVAGAAGISEVYLRKLDFTLATSSLESNGLII